MESPARLTGARRIKICIGCIMYVVFFFLFVVPEKPAYADNSEAEEDTVVKIRLEAEDPDMLADQLEIDGYVVLRGSITDTTLDLLVSIPESEELKKRGLDIVDIEIGRPLKEIRNTNDGSDAVQNGYPTLSVINDTMQNVAHTFPDIAMAVDLTEKYGVSPTYEGRHIIAIKISDNVNDEEDEPAIMMVCNHHADEVVGTVIALNAIKQFTETYGTDPKITEAVNNYEIWIAPTWNPDGLEFVFNNNSNWRKNRRVFNSGKGVDLNRNYPQGWSSSCSGSTSASSNTHKGPEAASESETQTMIAWSSDQRFAKILDYHSDGREVVYGYRCSSHPFRSFMEREARALASASGYGNSARAPSAEGEHYQWQFGKMGAWAYLIETALSHQPSYASALKEAERVWPGILHAIDRPITLSGHVTDARTGLPLVASIELVGVNFRKNERNASDKHFGRYHAFLPTGQYQVRFSCPGYLAETVPVAVSANTDAEVLDVVLWPDTSPNQYSLVSDVSGEGHVSLNPAGGTYPEGTQVAATATPEVGWVFDHWEGEASGSDNPLKMTMDAEKSITAVFVEGQGPGRIAFDGFESGNFNGGDGWLARWSRIGNLGLARKQPYEGRRYAMIAGGANAGRLERAVDLSSASSVRLRFASRVKSFEGDDKAYVKVSSDGVNYSVVAEFASQDSDNSWHLHEIDLSGFIMSADFRIVFEGDMSKKKKDKWYLDNIEVLEQ